MKKHPFFLFSFFLFTLVAILPLETSAQSYSSEWRGRSSSLRRKINSLSDNKVSNVPVPILFGVTPDNLNSDFGDPRSGGRLHEGQDIITPRRAPVVTPTDAIVLQTGVGESAGNYVYTANPGGETFAYMHLDEIADINEGDKLDKGELIGYVGNTGNASGGVTHLHFEIHDNKSNPTDPYLRIKSVFPLADKIKYLKNILDSVDDAKNLAERIVVLYRKELILAKTLNILLPPEIEVALTTIPVSVKDVVPTKTNTTTNDLTLGSQGSAVITLQKFLISKNAGLNNGIVADGAFGPITQKALAEYQAGAGIKPANGYYGPITRAYILAHP